MRSKWIWGTLAAMMVSGCSLSWLPFYEYVPSEAEQSADLAKRAGATPGLNHLGFSVFNGVMAAHPGENIALSPTGLGRMLLMAYAGARNGTRDAMARTLGMVDQSDATLGNWAVASGPNLDRRGVSIGLSDLALIKADFQVQQTYKDDLRRLFSADVKSYKNADEGTSTLRDWIKSATDGLIDGKDFRLEADTVLALADALVFKGKWGKQFDKGQTQTRPFFRTAGQSTPVPMMQNSDHYAYAATEGYQIIRLPYERGVYAMYVVLPPDEATASSTLEGDRFERLRGAMSERQGQIMLPRFTMSSKVDLKDPLSAAGMQVAFTDAADFGGIAPSLLISKVEQQDRVAVDEEGTVAAAVTVGQMAATSAVPSNPFVMEVNRPFFFAIRDDASQAVLFLGRVLDP